MTHPKWCIVQPNDELLGEMELYMAGKDLEDSFTIFHGIEENVEVVKDNKTYTLTITLK